MPKDALLEIYVEELPVSFIPPALEQVRSLTEKLLAEYNLKYKSASSYATPRRLVAYIEGLAEKTEKKTEEILGPSVNIAYDKNNNPTGAAEGFARSHNIAVTDLKIKELPKGRYICAERSQPVLDAEIVLRDLFRKVICGISFPKTMVWEKTRFRFARPIRSLLALYGNKVINKFEIAGIKPSNYTYGLFAISSKKIKIVSADKYLSALRNNNVLADHIFRREVLCKIIENASISLKCRIADNPGLVSEINFLVEHPVAVTGKFPDKFLSLPEETLSACMEKKQKFFPTLDSKGKMTGHFLGIRNGVSENQDTVREGYERVLIASLNDAKFFYDQDTRTPLESKVEKLKGVVFHEKLGTMYDKTLRLKDIAGWLHGCLKDSPAGNASPQEIERAALLSKADLVTNMVFEYGELQGTAGRIYAAHDGEPAAVSSAIEEHYWPLSPEGKLPSSLTGAIISLADKADTMACDFSIGLIPTGSGDPYGLRRQAIGILRIIREKGLKIRLSELFKRALGILPVKPRDTTLKDLTDFFRQRLEPLLENEGYKFDEIRAVLDAGMDDLLDADARLKALHDIRKQPDFEPLITAYKRAGNILKQAQKNKISLDNLKTSEGQLKQEEELKLYKEYLRVSSEVQALLNGKEYTGALASLVSLRPAVDSFFDKVMVMADDEMLRNNRLALLQEVFGLFSRIGNLSLLQ